MSKDVVNIGRGVTLIRVDNGGRFRPTNCLLIDSEAGLILIDPGADSESNIKAITSAAKQMGYPEKKVMAAFATHGHPDHVGCFERVQTAFDCECYVHPLDFPLARSFPAHFKKVMAMLTTSGYVSREEPEGDLLGRLLDGVGDQLEARVKIMELTDETAGVYGLSLVETPGHTMGSVSLLPSVNPGVIFVGDTVLPTLTAFLTSVDEFFRSMAVLRASSPRILVPGHGELLSPALDWINRMESKYRSRVEQVIAAAQPAMNLSRARTLIYGDLRDNLHQVGERLVAMQLAQTLGYLKYGVTKGYFVEDRSDGIVRFRKAERAA